MSMIPDYRPFIPVPGQSRIMGRTAREHALKRLKSERVSQLFGEWNRLAAEPFTGLTSDGTIQTGLCAPITEQIPVEQMVMTATRLYDRLHPQQRKQACHAVGSHFWRKWQNTEIFHERHGLRLEELSGELRSLTMAVVKASLSPSGYEQTVAAMKLNGFLGMLLQAPGVLNQWSYNFNLFGMPSVTEPWGWQLYGHHLALNCMVTNQQMVLTPTFLGAEISYADQDPFTGLQLFQDHERLGLELVNQLSDNERSQAVVSTSMAQEDLPEGRWHFADYLNLGGAFQDNRTVPYEGIRIDQVNTRKLQMFMDLVAEYMAPLPDGPRHKKMEQIATHLAETFFAGSAVRAQATHSITGFRARSLSLSLTIIQDCS